MNKYILFSAVGGHDPIANYHDGAILHICRTYKPKKVCLFLSKEMTDRHNLDNRYVDSLNRLQELVNFKIENIELIKKEDLTEVQLFDTFYQEFESVIKRLQTENPEDTILLNVSSGTPAMKSAMEIISTLSDDSIKSIQVSTPRKKENFKSELPENYDNELYWETNEDNCEDYTNRCLEVNSLNLMAKIKKEAIIEHIKNYDYHAAYVLAKSISKHLDPLALNMLNAALKRSQLDIAGYNEIAKANGFNFLPVKNLEIQPAFEYTLILDVKRKQRQYADFIRAVSPVIQDIFAIYLKKNHGINFKKNYCKAKILKDRKVYYPDIQLMNKTELGKKIKRCLLKSIKIDKLETQFYSSAQLRLLIKEFSDDVQIKQATEKLRNVEQNVRNTTAHEIVSISDEKIKDKAGISSEQIVELIKLFIEKSANKMKDEYWNSYDDMNNIIINALQK